MLALIHVKRKYYTMSTAVMVYKNKSPESEAKKSQSDTL